MTYIYTSKHTFVSLPCKCNLECYSIYLYLRQCINSLIYILDVPLNFHIFRVSIIYVNRKNNYLIVWDVFHFLNLLFLAYLIHCSIEIKNLNISLLRLRLTFFCDLFYNFCTFYKIINLIANLWFDYLKNGFLRFCLNDMYLLLTVYYHPKIILFS